MARSYISIFDERQYMQDKYFELYYYEDSYFSGVKNHVHDYYEFYFFLEGNMEISINHKKHTLKHGDVILIPPGIPHHVINHDYNIPYRRFIFWLDEEYLTEITSRSEDLRYIFDYTAKHKKYIYSNDIIEFNVIEYKLIHLIEEKATQRFGYIPQISLCVYDLILHLNRMAYETINPVKTHTNQSLDKSIIAHIENHLDEELTLDSIAETFFVSKYHIAHLFKQKFGISIHQYITKKRLDMCKNALSSELNITEIFHRFGFHDYSSFYRAFKKEFGLSPKEYRELHSTKLKGSS